MGPKLFTSNKLGDEKKSYDQRPNRCHIFHTFAENTNLCGTSWVTIIGQGSPGHCGSGVIISRLIYGLVDNESQSSCDPRFNYLLTNKGTCLNDTLVRVGHGGNCPLRWMSPDCHMGWINPDHSQVSLKARPRFEVGRLCERSVPKSSNFVTACLNYLSRKCMFIESWRCTIKNHNMGSGPKSILLKI